MFDKTKIDKRPLKKLLTEISYENKDQGINDEKFPTVINDFLNEIERQCKNKNM